MADFTNALVNDWFIQPRTMTLSRATSTASISCVIASSSTRLCGLFELAGSVFGEGVPDSLDYHVEPVLMLLFRAFSIRSLNGLDGTVNHGDFRFGSNDFTSRAFRRNGNVLFEARLNTTENVDFNITGLWIFKSFLQFDEQFRS